MLHSFVENACQAALYPLSLALQKALRKAHQDSHLLDTRSKMVAAVCDKAGRKSSFSIKVNQEQEQDFLAYRSETYVKPMTQGVAKELAALLLGLNKAEKPDVEVLQKMFLRVPEHS